MKKFLSLIVLLPLFFGCDNYKRKQYTTVEAAPVTTLVYFDDFKDDERSTIENNIVQNITNVNVTFNVDLDVEVNVTKNKVKPTWRGRKLLIWCGERNELPDLFDELCKKARGHHGR